MTIGLIKSAILNDQQSQRILYEMFYKRVYNTSFSIVKDSHSAQDIAQETFIKAFKQLHKLTDLQKMGPWLHRIAIRTSFDYLRKIKNQKDFPIYSVYLESIISKKQVSPSVEDILENKFNQKIIHSNLMKLKAQYRDVLILKYQYDMKDEEIAKVIRISLGTVKSRLFRAKKVFKKLILEDPV